MVKKTRVRKKKVNVRGHNRNLKNGKVVPVKPHVRQITKKLARQGVKTRIDPNDEEGFITLNKSIVKVKDKVIKQKQNKFFGNVELIKKTIHAKEPASEKDDIDIETDVFLIRAKELNNIIDDFLIGDDLIFAGKNEKQAKKIYKKIVNSKTVKEAQTNMLKAFIKSKKQPFEDNRLTRILGFLTIGELPIGLEFRPTIPETEYRPVGFLESEKAKKFSEKIKKKLS